MCTTRATGARLRLEHGFTLIELMIFIVVLAIALGGVLAAFDYTARDSADPLTRKQALSIADSLLAEIQHLPFTYCDPDDPAVDTAASPAGCASPEAIGPEPGETRYSTATPFDNVNDYDGYDTAAEVPPGVKDLTGTPIAGLARYNATASITPAALPGIPAGDALLITVRVTGPGNVSVSLEGYRTRHAPNL